MERWRSRWMRVGGTAAVLVVLAGWLGGGQRAVAQSSPRIEARVAADSVKIGERFTVRLVAEHDADAAAVFPASDAGAALFGDLHVVQRGAVQSRRASPTRRVDSVAYEVTTFALDSARVPILPVRLVAGPDTTVAGTVPQVVPVRSVVEPDDEVLRTPAALASFPWPLWAWGALLLSALALTGGLVYAWRRWGEEDASASDADDDPPPPEVLTALRRHPEVQGVVLRRLQTVLQQADLVKFADAEPSPERSQSVLEDARSVIDALESAQRRTESASVEEESASV
ncbi:MAG: hypothetical protein BRD27_04555 [Bacteroidetes bacterium QH_10_64_19]|nr:MAG: hypothetical protein BRD27_04555 [Bacteroidetes bacterium QH_10_64_19]